MGPFRDNLEIDSLTRQPTMYKSFSDIVTCMVNKPENTVKACFNVLQQNQIKNFSFLMKILFFTRFSLFEYIQTIKLVFQIQNYPCVIEKNFKSRNFQNNLKIVSIL